MAAAASAALSKSQRALLLQFTSLTGASEAQATKFLRRAGWSVEAASDTFFESGEAPEGAPNKNVNVKKIEAEFAKFEDPAEPGCMNGDQVLAFAEKLGVDPFSDPAILVIAFHMGAKQQGCIRKAEFVAGFTAIGVETVGDLRARLPALRKELDGDALFKKWFDFVYSFSCEDGQKSAPRDILREMLPIVLPLARFPLRDELVVFMGMQARTMTRDAWNLLLDFGASLKPDLSGYDDAQSWPSLLDDFVAYMRKQGGGGAGASAAKGRKT